MNIEELSIKTIRMLALDTVQKANSGHPGLPLGAAPMAYTIFKKFLKVNPKNPFWVNRDRFILSAGHGSALLYSLLYLVGYEKMTLDELKNFRQWGSKTPGHPEYNLECGIEITTGPLGQGFATGVGMAIAESHLAATYNRPDFNIVDHYIYAIVSDGDLMEGVAAEAASLAGHLQLGKLIYLYDNNHISLASETGLHFTEDVKKRFEAYHWQVLEVEDGNDVAAIEKAIQEAKTDKIRPSLIMITTHIGYGSPKQDTFEVHGSPLKPEEAIATKKFFNWPEDTPFFVPDEVLTHMRETAEKGSQAENDWNVLFAEYSQKYPAEAEEFDRRMKGILPENWAQDIPVYPPETKSIATRSVGGEVMNAIAKNCPSLMGGSADLDPSTNTVLKGKGTFHPPVPGAEKMQGVVAGPFGYAGRNLVFGVREHAMGSILNGMALHGGIIPYGATFLTFSDYLRPAIRLAALSNLHVIYVFTHDSIGLGEDGPTHQPVEHITSLRTIPNLLVIRPADANETAQAWKVAVEAKGPVALIFSRQKLAVIDQTKYASAKSLARGAYILADSYSDTPDIILIATGSEVGLALKASEKLTAEGIKVRVVSMPSWELFEQQSEEYRHQVLPPSVMRRISIEAGVPIGWERYVGDQGVIIGVNRFGASAPGELVMEKFGFSVENIIDKARKLLAK
ncbi:MAG: transketolase [Candidatus Atribacteria bacterium]|nr:transketolase [Candidatus Atribacteria bacterium]